MVDIPLTLRRVAGAAIDLVAPPVCLACPARESGVAGLCRRCAGLVRPRPAGTCPRCAATLGPGADLAACRDCEQLSPKFTATVAAASYAGFAGELVRRAKYGRDAILAWPLERLLSDAVAAWPGREGIDAVVPVPTTDARRSERGFHLADALAAAVGLRLGRPARPTWLLRPGDPSPQAALPRGERRRAARGTVVLRRGLWILSPARALQGRTLLVVDDVLTTGATANECAKVLLAAGAAEVRIAVAARA